ncbi:sensor domain-containing diguanylate cyclase [Psychrobacillus sp.]|uniref:sensor domain-containing diguanylate cyclase n=1 Tax=Psychrobacillus sp. TaxID=1871623 RepID=UPI0028BE1CA2|nr:sensor domain-containing diguanylate cyclase [Psychrobacillus sp.]
MKRSLRFWILMLTTFTIVGIISSSLFSGYIVTKKSLIDVSLENNKVYSTKLAKMSDKVFKDMQENLESRKQDIIGNFEDETKLTAILDELLVNSKNFNSLSIIGSDGVAIATSPNIGIAGNKIDSEGVQEALRKKANIITSPYKAVTGRLLILVSTPLFDGKNNYIGMLNGTIYLQEDNFIRNILAEHFAEDGSYVYVVDKNGTLIYHPDGERIGESVKGNKVVQQLMQKKSGILEFKNLSSNHFLAGYTYIDTSNWGVVSQTPYASSLDKLSAIMWKIFLFSLPFAIIFYMVAYILSERLASPLKKLALYTMSSQNDRIDGNDLYIPVWYFEAKQLTETIISYRKRQEETVQEFKIRSLTDPLTGLKNRRYSEILFADLVSQNKLFSIIMLDIDHFKKVNDEFGHSAGDEVLKFIAEKMNSASRVGDVCTRLGGEEFAIILPNASLQQAFDVAEKLRQIVEEALPPTGKHITISSGVGEWRQNEETVNDLMHRVDMALYEAKASGRNKTIISTFK